MMYLLTLFLGLTVLGASNATTCSTPSGEGTCISTASCGGTNVAGYCPGAADIQCCVISCHPSSGPGFCEQTTQSCSGGSFVTGYCPGPSNIKCCVAKCSTPSGNGACQWTGSTCSGKYVAGYCPGPANIECCVESSSGPGTTGSGNLGLDISGQPTAAFWTCAAPKYDVIAIEGYIQGCAKGGEVKSNFVTNYKNAKAAGIKRIDAYLFPCTGTQDTGVACKSPSTQMSEFLAAIANNDMTLGHLWLDIEPTSTANGDACNAWNLGSSANIALAKQWVSLMKSSGLKWGIYANGNQWSGMFGTRAADVGSSLPLWAVQDDFTAGVNTVTTFMGGWTSAVAKQYHLDTTACGFSVDLDSFQ